MRILKDKGIDGIVGIHSTYEIPACIIMDYIEGPTLREAIETEIINQLHEKLFIIKSVSEMIIAATYHKPKSRIALSNLINMLGYSKKS